jgi:hypothetical protein
MTTQIQVIQLHQKNPTLTAPQIAERLGCKSAYVRATAQRCGLTLAGCHVARSRQDTVTALGRAARAAGLLTVADVEAAAKAVRS